MYALFRTFLFNYYFAFLADRLGFRYFGVLAGLSFFIAGMAGLVLQSRVMNFAHGPCIENPEGCDQNRWQAVNQAKAISLALLFAMPMRTALFKIIKSVSSTNLAQMMTSPGEGLPPRANSHSGVGSSPGTPQRNLVAV